MTKKLAILLTSCSFLGYFIGQAEAGIQTPHATYSDQIGETFPHSGYVKINPRASTIIVSGQAADNLEGDLFQDTIEEAVEVALSNVERLLQEAGAGMENVVYITMAVRDGDDWKGSAEAYNKFFSDRGIEHRPAITTVQAINAEHRIMFTAQAAIIKDEA